MDDRYFCSIPKKLIENRREYYLKMAEMCSDILDGKSIMKVCRNNFVSFETFRNQLKYDSTLRRDKEIKPAKDAYTSCDDKLFQDIVKPIFEDPFLFKRPNDFKITLDSLIHSISKPNVKKAIEMYYFEDYTYAEISSKLELSIARISTLIHEGLHYFRRRDNLLKLIFGETNFRRFYLSAPDEHLDRIIDILKTCFEYTCEVPLYFDLIIDAATFAREQYLEYEKEKFNQKTKLEVLRLQNRTINAIYRGSEIRTVEDLMCIDERTLLTIPYFGKTCLEDTRKCLAIYLENLHQTQESP